MCLDEEGCVRVEISFELLCCEELQVVESNWRHKISRTRTESVGFPPKSFFQNLGEISAELHQRSSYYLSSQILTLYKLQYEKTHPVGFLHYAQGKTVTQVTIAHLKEKVSQVQAASTSSFSAGSGVRSVAARLLGGSNGSRALSFVGGNGTSKTVVGSSKIGSLGGLSSSSGLMNSNYDGKGTYLVFNVGDTVFISDLNSQDKDPIKSIHFGNSNPICHAFDPEAKDGHDLLIGLNSGDVYSVSLRQQLQDFGKKLIGAQHYNKDGSVNNRQEHIIFSSPTLV
ncbi:hypothetical protein ACHQM5_001171 [Ranunculus cassubicifolius]